MKIAILFAGRILNYDTYYNNLKHFILKDHDVDIFLSHSKELNEDLSGFINLYKPKIVIDMNIDNTIKYNGPLNTNYGGLCMFCNRYRIFQAFKKYCQEQAIKYDLIMVYRLDLLALSDINFKNFTVLKDDIIYIPNVKQSKGYADIAAIGNFNAIEKYCNLYISYDDVLEKCFVKDSNELILKIYLDDIRMRINYFPYTCLLRETIWLNGGGENRINNEQITTLIIKD